MRLQIDQKQKEVKAHGTYGFPVLVSPERLSWFDTGEFPWHWHPEIELTLILEGEILYQVNDNSCLLKAGEGLFCNTNVLHAGRHGNSADCSYLSVTFHPRLLYGYNNSLMQNRYMEGILRDPELASIHFKPEVDWQKKVLEQIRKIQRLSADKAEASELKIQIALMGPDAKSPLSRKICPSVMEITLVGMYADTSPACVSIIGSAVIEPPPSSSLRRLDLSRSLE